MIEKTHTTLLRLRADTLAVHPVAQRAIVKTHLGKIVAVLDLDKIGVLHVVQYAIRGSKRYWIVDGQHRWRALMDHGFGEWVVDVMVHDDAKDDATAAKVFLALNQRAAMAPYDRYHNRLTAGDEASIGISRIARRYGIAIARGAGDRKATCVVALEAAYARDAGKTLDATLNVIQQAWAATADSLEGQIVAGLSIMLATFGEEVDIAALAHKLAKAPGGARRLIGDANGLRQRRPVPLSRCVAEVIVDYYNNGRRKGTLAKSALFSTRRPSPVAKKHLASKPGEDAIFADVRQLQDKYGKRLTRRKYINEAKTGRRYEKYYENFGELIAAAKAARPL